MLRSVLLVLGIVLLLAALALALVGAPLALVLWLACPGGVLSLGILVERGRYKPTSSSRLGPDWIATGERFVDPESGEIVEVYHQPSTGERRYVGR